MDDADLKRSLASVVVPGELEARRRSWSVVRSVFEERERVPRARARNWPVLALAGAAIVIAAAITPPGRAVLGDVRDAIGREQVIGVEGAQPSLFSLPTRGDVLVDSARGPWIVRPDGGKRLLGRYEQASWSPFAQFVVASRGNELVALERDGDVRWSLARRNARHPRWSGTRTDTRIAYLSGRSLRVVAGDSMGDGVLVSRVADVAPAWQPGGAHVLAFALPNGRVRVIDADSSDVTAGWDAGRPEQLAFSADGSLVATRAGRSLSVHTVQGLRRATITAPVPGGEAGQVLARFLDAAFAPTLDTLAYTTHDAAGGRSAVWTIANGGRGPRQQLFAGAGRMTDVEWSPDGRWLLVAWETANQWVFVRPGDGATKIVARSSITEQLNGAAANAEFPHISGWCCP